MPYVPAPRRPHDLLLRELDARFDSALAREEEVAADDLALALRQDVELQEVLLRAPHAVLLEGGVRAPIVAVAPDHIVAGGSPSYVVPAGRAAFAPTDGRRLPELSGMKLTERLRRAARVRSEVTVAFQEGHATGVLTLVGRDHLRVSGPFEEIVVPAEAVRYVRLSLWDSEDVL